MSKLNMLTTPLKTCDRVSLFNLYLFRLKVSQNVLGSPTSLQINLIPSKNGQPDWLPRRGQRSGVNEYTVFTFLSKLYSVGCSFHTALRTLRL